MHNKIIILLSLALIGFTLYCNDVNAKTFKPQSISDLYKTSVRIYNKAETSGGTGSIFRSYSNASHILTNKHVCRLIEQGGKVDYDGRMYSITHYKKFSRHDLCLVRVEKNFKINTVIADKLAKKSSTTYVSGHPNLLPHIATKGHLSGRMDIQIVVGTKKCKDDDTSIECAWFGGKPVVKTFDSIVVSNLIKPGNSGSAVFNAEGEVVGVVYAGSGSDFSHGFIVPHIYVIFFLQNAHRYKWIKVGTPVDDEEWMDRVFDFSLCNDIPKKDTKYDIIKDICGNIKDNMIWRQ